MSHEGWSRVDVLGIAFSTALILYRGKRSGHFLVALVVGAALTHLGWAALYWNLVRAHPGVLLDPLVGSCVLFLPLGPLLIAPEAASWRALPAALAVARTACIFGGCCYGKPLFLGAPIGILAEVSAFLALHGTLRRVPDSWVLPLFLATFGSLRLLLEPLRSMPPLGPPLVPAVALAGLWAGLGLCEAVAQSVRLLRS